MSTISGFARNADFSAPPAAARRIPPALTSATGGPGLTRSDVFAASELSAVAASAAAASTGSPSSSTCDRLIGVAGSSARDDPSSKPGSTHAGFFFGGASSSASLSLRALILASAASRAFSRHRSSSSRLIFARFSSCSLRSAFSSASFFFHLALLSKMKARAFA